MPGMLPVANKRAIDLGIAAGLVTNCRISPVITFDKKNYFYPDLPAGYQITQLFSPICRNGHIDIDMGGDDGVKRINIKQIHIEEDASKLVHKHGMSLVDFNRGGVALVEIVSEPDFRSAGEVIAYLEKLRSLLTFAGVSDCKLQEGSMRCDVNLSVRERGAEALGTRTEMKNINSLSAIARAIAYEGQRHIDALEAKSGELVQETRRWDDSIGETFSMRSKEDATDYRYFPNADIMPIHISEEWIEAVRGTLPESAQDKYSRMTGELGISRQDSKMITGSKRLSDIFDAVTGRGVAAKDAVSWIITDLLSMSTEENKSYEDIYIDCGKFAELISMVDRKAINRNVAKKILVMIYEDDIDPVRYVEENNLGMVSDASFLEDIIKSVISENPKPVGQYRGGDEKVFGFLMGKAMSKTAGKADPAVVRELLKGALKP
jgi:aspartyl-tRNA(Asn)/glutamyl-tRNA(Gln) amidotransferase subunit B